ncbi:hypothetical protein M2281_002554 [Mesorhizobium soli]|nr:hypothetical protein [Mesorhizobium soli]
MRTTQADQMRDMDLFTSNRTEALVTSSAIHKLKGAGYLISTVSVLLLAFVSWQHAKESVALTACLLVGALASIIGMFCRWLTYEIEKRQTARSASPDIAGLGRSGQVPDLE